jgi:hypothetical protein
MTSINVPVVSCLTTCYPGCDPTPTPIWPEVTNRRVLKVKTENTRYQSALSTGIPETAATVTYMVS